MKPLRITFIITATVLGISMLGVQGMLATPLYADGKSADGSTKPNPARDERLPPVIPGEVVKGDDGSEIKVWSSAGPVPSGHVPAPPVAPGVVGQGAAGGVGGGIGGVIVDGRGLLPNTSTGEAPQFMPRQ